MILQVNTLTLLIFLRQLSCSSSNLESIFMPTIKSRSVKNFLDSLNNCHLKFYLNLKSSSVFHVAFTELSNRASFMYSIIQINHKIQPPIHTISEERQVIHRNINCYAHIFMLSPKLKFIKEQSVKTSPDLVIYFTSEDRKFVNQVYTNLRTSYYTVIYAFIVFNMTQVKSVCLVCLTFKSIEVHETFPTLITSVSRQYFKNANLNKHFINSDLGGGEKSRRIKSCDRSTDYSIRNRPPTLEKCVVLEISRKLNFTFNRSWHYGPYPRIKRRQRLSQDYYENEVKPQIRVFSELGFVFDQWGYLVVKERIHGSDKALTGPFGVQIWIAFLISFMFLVFVYFLGLFCQAMLTINNVGAVTIALIGSVVDQSIFPRIIRKLKISP